MVWAITLRALTVLVVASTMIRVLPGWARSRAPSALVTPTAGIVTSVPSPRVAPMCSSSTLLATTIATPPNWATIAYLVREGAAAAVDQHHRAAHRQPVVVGGGAARGLVGGCGDQRSADPLGRGAEAELQGSGLHDRAADRHLGLAGLEDPGAELGGLHVEPLGPQARPTT